MAMELRQFVEEQHAVVPQPNLAWGGVLPPPTIPGVEQFIADPGNVGRFYLGR
jgi:hypothetical protein